MAELASLINVASYVIAVCPFLYMWIVMANGAIKARS